MAAVIVLLSGCKSAPLEQTPSPIEDAGTMEHARIAWEDFPGRLAEVHCSALERCCDTAELEFTWNDCHTEMTGAYLRSFERLLPLAVEYDAAASADCVASVRRHLATCRIEPNREVDTSCSAVFQGTLQTSEPCVATVECASVEGVSAFCKTASGSANAACEPRIAETGTCLLEGCQDGLFCSIDTLTCTPLVTEGDCFLITDCVPAAFCSPNLRCEPKRVSGAACLNDLECVSGFCAADGACQGELASASSCAG